MPECCGLGNLMPTADLPCSAALFPANSGLFGKFRAAAARLALIGALAASLTLGAQAQGRVPVVRDAEIEALVREYAKPILKAAGLSNQNIEIILVNDARFNAFVTGRKMFINTGALMQAETPNEIIGVIAHEAGHIAGGHQQRLRQQLERAQTMAVVAGLLGMGAIAAGAATKTEGLGQVGAGVVAGGAEAARRGLLNYQRSEEVTADRSALTYLERTGQSAKGMLKTFARFQGALSLSGARVDPYLQSHLAARSHRQSGDAGARKPAFRQARLPGPSGAPPCPGCR